MQRPSFTVVSTTVTLLAVIGAVVKLTAPYLPPETYNKLQFEKSPFLKRGGGEKVHWKLLEPGSFAEARRLGRPVFLLVGAAWSDAARQADELIFTDPETVTYLNGHFICMRVDADSDPCWFGAFLPLSRSESSRWVLPGLQAWFLDSDGQLIGSVGGFGLTKPIEPATFMREVLEAQETFDKLRSEDPASIPAGEQQRLDMQALFEAPPRTPSFEPQDAILQQIQKSEYGGFPIAGHLTVVPSAFRYLLRTGRYDAFRERMDPLLRSPIIDWLDGGFFAVILSEAPPRIDFDKISTQNAELMSTLGQASILLNEPLYRRVALATFDWLAKDMQVNGFIASSQITAPLPNGRSPRSSFSPQRLRETLEPIDREWARNYLGLRVEDNPPMVLWIKDPAATFGQEKRFEEIRSKLRAKAKAVTEFGPSRQLDVNGFVIARMFETARILGDPKRLSIAVELLERIDWFRAGDDVKHSLDEGSSEAPYLGDYLAFADACLQGYLATGSPYAFENGLRVLQRAKFLFETSPGLWITRVRPPEPPGPANVMVPELFDLTRESLTAQVIRLQNAYGRLISGTANTSMVPNLANAARLSQGAVSAMEQFGSFSERLALFGSGYFAASLGVLDERYAIVVGPDAQQVANSLSQRLPTRLIAAAQNLVRKDLQKSPPGIYISGGLQTTGPFSLAEALGRLPPAFGQSSLGP